MILFAFGVGVIYVTGQKTDRRVARTQKLLREHCIRLFTSGTTIPSPSRRSLTEPMSAGLLLICTSAIRTNFWSMRCMTYSGRCRQPAQIPAPTSTIDFYGLACLSSSTSTISAMLEN